MAVWSWFESPEENEQFDMSHLKMDQAYFTVRIENQSQMYRLYYRHLDCIKCPFQLMPIENGKIFDGHSMILTDVSSISYRLSNGKSYTISESDPYICEFGRDFGEFGIYQLNVNGSNCTVETLQTYVSIYFPFFTITVLYAITFLIVFFVFLKEKTIESVSKRDNRIRSIDVFRGISILVMLFVNNGAGGFPGLTHATWDGINLADFVAPWFIWICGFCIPISLSSNLNRRIPIDTIYWTILKRSLKLFVLGVFVSSTIHLECLRFFGVLQRIATVYLVLATSFLAFSLSRKTISSNQSINMIPCRILSFGILVVHTLILFLVADEHCTRGYLGPGGLHDEMKHVGCTGGATGYIDKLILGNHRHNDPGFRDIFKSDIFEPDGIFGCLTCIFQGYLGLEAGLIFLTNQQSSERFMKLISWGFATGFLGFLLSDFIPPNRNLWSLTFVLITSASSFFILCIILWVLSPNSKISWNLEPLAKIGRNALLVYLGQEVFEDRFPFRWTVRCDGEHSNHFQALLESTWSVVIWIVLVCCVDSKGLFI